MTPAELLATLALIKERCVIRSYPFQEGSYRGRWWIHIGNTVRVWVNEEGSISSTHTKVGWVHDLLRQRLTMADIIADPGDGWSVIAGSENLFFEHGAHLGTHRAVSVQVSRSSGRVVGESISTSLQGTKRIAVHKAITDLLIKLEELDPGEWFDGTRVPQDPGV